ncbi:MAG: type II toxin-antitoxin system VapB family antitoxin [Alphaproteobacteria bacterium]
MRTRVTIDDAMLATAKELTGIEETGALVRAGLEALVQREAARRLARLGGSEGGAADIPRRRPAPTVDGPRGNS